MLGWISKFFAAKSALPGYYGLAKKLRARYDAAASSDESRRHWANADNLSAAAANSPTVRQILRNRARYEIANNSYARGIVSTLANDVIGTGPRLQMLSSDQEANRRIEAAFAQWADAIGLPEKLRVMRMARTQDGEAFAMLVTNSAIPTEIKLDLRLVESDQVSTPGASGITAYAVDGIEFDGAGNPTQYHVLKNHPGSGIAGGAADFDRVPAAAMIHWFRADRPGQARGIPEVTSALPLFAQLRRFTLAVIAAAETAADHAGILYSDAPPDGADEAEPFEPIELEKRSLVTMPAGWRMEQMKSEQPTTTYKDFKGEILNEIARCLNMPFNIAACNSSSYNYASGRLDHQTYYKSNSVDQTHCESRVLNRILKAWLDEAALVPGLLPSGMIAELLHQWFWDGHEHVDPNKDANAQATRLASNTTTLAHEYAKQGLDWEQALRQRAVEITLMKELGILGVGVSSGTPVKEDDKLDDEETDDADEKPVKAAVGYGSIALRADAGGEMIRLCAAPGALELLAAEGEGEAKKLRRFNLNAYNGGAMKANLYWPVVVDLAGMTVPSQRIPILKDHDSTQIVGHTDKIELTSRTVKMSGTVSGVGLAAQEILATSENGFPWGTSLGASIEQLEFVDRGNSVKVNGMNFSGPVYVVRKSTLRETSFTAVAADASTWSEITARFSEEFNSMNFETWLAAQALEIKSLVPAAVENLKKVHAALHPPRSGEPAAPLATPLASPAPAAPVVQAAAPHANQSATDHVAAIREATAVELDRQTKVQKLTADHPELAVKAVRENWDATRTELEVLRAARPAGPAIHSRGGEAPSTATLEAALCLSAGLPEKRVGEWYGEKALTAAASRDYRGIGLHELFHTVIAASGGHARPGHMSDDVIRAAFTADRALRATEGFSTIALSGILGNVANKALIEAFTAVEGIANTICGIGDANDFKQMTKYRLTSAGLFEKVGKDGELKHATFAEQAFTNQVETYGKMVALTRQDIINDDLGSFLSIPKMLGRQAALAVESAVFTLLLSNPSSFFATANKNNQTGAGTVLQISSLTTAEQLFMDQVDSDGKPILISPKYLLVPTALKVVAQQLMTETRINETTTANAGKPGNNPHAGKWEVAASPYLNSQGLTGSSATAWYLLANPADVAFIELAYLRGQRTPIIESGETSFNTLGMHWRGYFDFGVGMQDHRAAVRSVGA